MPHTASGRADPKNDILINDRAKGTPAWGVVYRCPTNPADCTATVDVYAVAGVPSPDGGIEAEIALKLTITVTPTPSEVITVVVTPRDDNTTGGGTVRIGPGTGNANTAVVKFRIGGLVGSAGSLTISATAASGSTGSYPMIINTSPWVA